MSEIDKQLYKKIKQLAVIFSLIVSVISFGASFLNSYYSNRQIKETVKQNAESIRIFEDYYISVEKYDYYVRAEKDLAAAYRKGISEKTIALEKDLRELRNWMFNKTRGSKNDISLKQ